MVFMRGRARHSSGRLPVVSMSRVAVKFRVRVMLEMNDGSFVSATSLLTTTVR